jgi:hypothetical protein
VFAKRQDVRENQPFNAAGRSNCGSGRLDDARKPVSLDPRSVAIELLLERASVDAMRELRRAGVRSILLKGPLQQHWLEPAGPSRVSTDVDLLVASAQFGVAEEALASVGFSRAVALPVEEGREHGSVWVAEGEAAVELHWTLVGMDEDKAWDVLSDETESVTLMGETVEIPNEGARCLIIAVHAAQHGIGEHVIFNDLERALVVAKPEAWQRAFELATRVGAWNPFAGALSLTSRGLEYLDEFHAPLPTLDEREALSLLTPAPTSRGFYYLSRQAGVRAKAAFILTKLAPSPVFMRLRYPFARRGAAGLGLAYGYRLLWLLRWSLPGLRSWRQAQRLASKRQSGPGT